MKRMIEQSDLALTYQHVICLSVRVDVYDKDMVYVDSMDCALISGSFSMDANSDVRRTISIVVSPTVRSQISLLIEKDSLTWINRNIVLSVGIQNSRTREVTYYKMGTFLVMTYASTYDPVTNQLTLNCSDYMAMLDGSKNGELSPLVTSFPAYKEYYNTERTGGTDCYYFTENRVTYTDNTYRIVSPIHTSYVTGDYVVFQIPSTAEASYYYFVGEDVSKRRSAFITSGENKPYVFITDNDNAEAQRTAFFSRKPTYNEAGAKFRWNNLPALDIYDIKTGQKIKAKRLKSGQNYAFRFDSNSVTLVSLESIDKVQDGIALVYYTIRDAMTTAVDRIGGIKDYNIDDIGEYLAMPQYNSDWWNYRDQNPLWDNIPYDLEFNVGDNVLSIITTLRDLYPNYETYFDEDGVFCCNMIPSASDDLIYLSNDYLQQILISESYNIDSSLVRNVCEVWGASLEVDFTADKCTLSGKNYKIDIDEYGDTVFTGDRIAILIEKTNPKNANIVIHTKYTEYNSYGETVEKEKTFDPMPILDEMTDFPLEEGTLDPGTMYVFKVKKKVFEGTEEKMYIYFQSEYQPQAIDVITNGTVSEELVKLSDGSRVPKWSKEYFADRYGCKIKNIHFTIDRYSPYTVQEIGEALSVKQGGEFENITSDQRARERAIYENWKSARLTDVVTLSTKLCLFFDVNKMVEYQRHDMEDIYQYVITSVSHDFTAGTSSITMTRFRPLYIEEEDGLTHDKLSRRRHNNLRRYTHDALGGK